MFTRPLYLHRHVLDHTTRSDSGIRSSSTASCRHASQSSICIHCPCWSNRVRLVEDIDLFLSIGLRSCAHETDRPSHCLHPRLVRAMIGSVQGSASIRPRPGGTSEEPIPTRRILHDTWSDSEGNVRTDGANKRRRRRLHAPRRDRGCVGASTSKLKEEKELQVEGESGDGRDLDGPGIRWHGRPDGSENARETHSPPLGRSPPCRVLLVGETFALSKVHWERRAVCPLVQRERERRGVQGEETAQGKANGPKHLRGRSITTSSKSKTVPWTSTCPPGPSRRSTQRCSIDNIHLPASSTSTGVAFAASGKSLPLLPHTHIQVKMDPVTSMLHAWCRNSIHHVAPVLEEGIPCWMVPSQLQVLTQEASLLPPMGDAFVQIKIECAFQCKRKYNMKHSKCILLLVFYP